MADIDLQASGTLTLAANAQLWGNAPSNGAVGRTTLTALQDYLSAQGFVRLLSATENLNPPNIPAGEVAALNITVTGAVVGLPCFVTPPSGLEAGLYLLQPRVTAANTVTAYIWNSTASAIDPAAGDWTAYVIG